MDTRLSRADAFNDWAEAHDWPARCDPDLNFDAPALTDLLGIWREQAGQSGMPQRSQLTARVLKSHLRHISIIERIGDVFPRYRVRLLGTQLAQMLGEMQGRYLDEVMPPEVAAHWQARLDLALAERSPVRFVSRVDMKKLYFLRSESFWAPLADEREPPSIVLMAAILTFNTASAVDNIGALASIA